MLYTQNSYFMNCQAQIVRGAYYTQLLIIFGKLTEIRFKEKYWVVPLCFVGGITIPKFFRLKPKVNFLGPYSNLNIMVASPFFEHYFFLGGGVCCSVVELKSMSVNLRNVTITSINYIILVLHYLPLTYSGTQLLMSPNLRADF